MQLLFQLLLLLLLLLLVVVGDHRVCNLAAAGV
jgi:hypothetical protein